MILYGLSTCDTCRKALAALKAAGHGVRLHDVRERPLDAAVLERFLATLGEGLVNRASTTWRGLSATEQALPPLRLLQEHPTLMKRPVIEGEALTLGWTAEVQARHMK